MKLKPNLVYRTINGKMFIVDMQNSMLHSINESGNKILELLKKGYDTESITQKFLKEYDVDKQQLEKDISNFVSLLKEKGILE
jgi:hypothetical protein